MPSQNKDDYDLRMRVTLGRANEIIRDGGQLLHLIPYEDDKGQRPLPRRYYTALNSNSGDSNATAEARDVIFATLKQLGQAVPRKTLSDALKKRGFSERSAGPICNLLQRDGLIVSPKRGYWEIKRARTR